MNVWNKIIRNTSANAVGEFFDVIMLIIITPLVFDYLGKQLFGLWSIVFVLCGYVSFVDFGISQSFTKFIAEYHARGDKVSINKILNTGFFFYFLIGIILTILVYIFLDGIIFKLFKIPLAYGNIAKKSILLAFGVMCTYNVFSCFSGLLDGMQRMDLRNGIMIITRILNFLGVLVVIHNDWGILGLTINASVRIVANIILLVFAGIKIFPSLKISIFFISKKIFKSLFDYGYKLQIVLIGNIILRNFIPMILSNILGLSYVTYYAVGIRIARLINIIPGFLLSALVPAISDLNARKREDIIDKIYYKGSKYLSCFTSWLVFGASTVIPYIFFLWLGSENREFSYTFYTIAIGIGIHIALLGVGSSVLRGIGIVKYAMHAAMIKSFIILILGVLIVRTFGFIGLLSLVFFATVVSSTYYCLKFDKFNNQKPLQLLRKTTLFPLLLGLILFCGFRHVIFISGFVNINRLISFGYFLLFGLAFSMIYFGIILLTGYFTRDEINYIKNKIQFIQSDVKFQNKT